MPLRPYLLIYCCFKSHHLRPNGEEYSTANHDEGTFPPHFLLDSLPATTMIIPYPKRPAPTTTCLLPSNSQSFELFLSLVLFTCSDLPSLLMCACLEMISGTLYRRCGLATSLASFSFSSSPSTPWQRFLCLPSGTRKRADSPVHQYRLSQIIRERLGHATYTAASRIRWFPTHAGEAD